jgi:hypothetical protein
VETCTAATPRTSTRAGASVCANGALACGCAPLPHLPFVADGGYGGPTDRGRARPPYPPRGRASAPTVAAARLFPGTRTPGMVGCHRVARSPDGSQARSAVMAGGDAAITTRGTRTFCLARPTYLNRSFSR